MTSLARTANDMLANPLLARDTIRAESSYFDLVLTECARYGVPKDALALFRDLHSMLGFSDPIGPNQMTALAAPLVVWRTHPSQPAWERIVDVERLAFHQRVLIAFGGGAEGEMVGRAEIVQAMGNLVKDVPGDPVPPEYYDVFQWASIDTLSRIQGVPREEILKQKLEQKWRDIPDAEVIKPDGRLYPTYQTICTSIRREARSFMDHHPLQHPRHALRPWAAGFLNDLTRVRAGAVTNKEGRIVELIDRQVATIREMFPGIGTVDEEILNRLRDVERELMGPSRQAAE